MDVGFAGKAIKIEDEPQDKQVMQRGLRYIVLDLSRFGLGPRVTHSA
jgi:hypothetical protein